MSDVLKTNRDINELTENAQTACNLFLSRCKEKGLNVLITETYRSQERQNYLYEQGRTRPGKIVTWTKNSRHTSKRAWDICKNVPGGEYSDSSFFKACGEVAKKLGITWGGDWKTPDTPHFEIGEDWENPEEEVNMEELKELKNQVNFLSDALDKLGDRVTRLDNPMVYNYVDENMPSWARETVRKLVNTGKLFGNENGELELTYDMLKILVILDRNNTFK